MGGWSPRGKIGLLQGVAVEAINGIERIGTIRRRAELRKNFGWSVLRVLASRHYSETILPIFIDRGAAEAPPSAREAMRKPGPTTQRLAGPVMAVAGIALWAGFSIAPLLAGGRLREAWDIDAYWTIGMPALLIAQAIAGFISQASPWRLGLWCAGGHFLAAVLIVPPGTGYAMAPFALVFIGVPLFIALTVSAYVGRLVARVLTA
jgi:hypothetical protein